MSVVSDERFAVVFDVDGTLADTERYGHLPAFNQTFAEFGLPVRWTEDEYGEKLRIGGGKERMASLLTPSFVAEAGLPPDPEGQAQAVAQWHKRKTEIYTAMVAAGALPARPGIARIVEEAYAGRLESSGSRRRRPRPRSARYWITSSAPPGPVISPSW